MFRDIWLQCVQELKGRAMTDLIQLSITERGKKRKSSKQCSDMMQTTSHSGLLFSICGCEPVYIVVLLANTFNVVKILNGLTFS